MSETNFYDKSNMPPGDGSPAPQPEPQNDLTRGPVTGPNEDSLCYPSLAAEGRWEVRLPLPNSGNMLLTETVQVRNLPRHVAEQTERGFRNDSAIGTLSWYVTHLKALKLFDAEATSHMDALVRGFSASGEPEKYFAEAVKPYLHSLVPQRG